MGFDFSITESGELILDEDNDIKKTSKDDLRIQRVICAIKSISSDWYNDNIGADLEQYIGEQISQELINSFVSSIYSAVIATNAVAKEDLFIVPNVYKTSIILSIFLKKINSNSSYNISVNFDMVKGVNISFGTT